MIVAAAVPGARAQTFLEGTTSVGGFAAFDLRVFPERALQTGQDDQSLNPSFVLQPEIFHDWNDGDDRLAFVPFARVDPADPERTHTDIRELTYLHVGEGWDIKIGADKVYWGVAESRHLVDIINQTDAVEDVDGEEKLGQPMVNLGLQNDWGDVNLFFMPYFRERTFPGKKGRLRSSIVIDTDRANYESSNGQHNPDMAVRYTTVAGDWDIGLSYFRGTSREPNFDVGVNETGDTILVPRYDLINQSSFDVQATVEEWLWKAEGIYRSGHGKNFGAATAGFEYSFYGLVQESGDLGVIVEYHYDKRDATAPGTLHNNDFFVGGRITLNDENDTDFLAGVLIDRNTNAHSFSLEADRRLSDHWTVEAELRISGGLTAEDVSFDARRDNHLQVRATYYF